jgi:hypothetical protein
VASSGFVLCNGVSAFKTVFVLSTGAPLSCDEDMKKAAEVKGENEDEGERG